ncbi:MAG: hypothetical protein ACPL3P_04435 [Anaerolineales bacterium]
MRDLREYSKQTVTRFVLGGLLIIIIIAEILIYFFYGKSAAISGLLCLLLGLVPLLLIWIFFVGLEFVVKKRQP